MVRESRTRLSHCSYTAVGVCMFLLTAPSLQAQLAKSQSPTSTLDAYGNARPNYNDRRSAGSFQSEIQYRRSRDYQDFGRRMNRRGGFSLFSLPGDYSRRVFELPRNNAWNAESKMFGVEREEAQKKYGGFSLRSTYKRDVTLDDSLQRRQALIAASSLNAPVHHALNTMGTSGVLNRTLGRTPFLESDKPEPDAEPTTVSQQLRLGVEVAHDRIRREAWDWFRLEKYRRAARAFDTAAQLDETDIEARIGQYFSYIALGSIRTAQVVLRSLNRQTTDPFLNELKITGAFSNAQESQRVRTQVALLASPMTQNAERHAMQALALWYMGATSEAETIVERLIGDTQDPRYSLWLERIRTDAAGIPQRPSQP